MNLSDVENPVSVTNDQESKIVDIVANINRCAKVVKGGRRFSFSALVISGDQNGKVGYGLGKANEVPDAIRKGTDRAHKGRMRYHLKGSTIPHEVIGKADGAKVLLKPAAPGTGVIAAGVVRAVLRAVGIQDILTKQQGSNNPMANVLATIDALSQLRTLDQIKAIRSKQ